MLLGILSKCSTLITDHLNRNICHCVPHPMPFPQLHCPATLGLVPREIAELDCAEALEVGRAAGSGVLPHAPGQYEVSSRQTSGGVGGRKDDLNK